MNRLMKQLSVFSIASIFSIYTMAQLIESTSSANIQNASNQSYVPILAYEGTYGLILGVAYFRYPNKLASNPSDQEFDVLLYAADGPIISLETRWKKYAIAQDLNLEVVSTVNNFFIKDYPNGQLEGNLIDRNNAKFNPKFTQNLTATHNLVYGLTLEYKAYEESAPQQYINATSLIGEIGYLIDERDNGTNSRNGYSLESTLIVKPQFLSTATEGTFSTKLEIDGRYYKSLSDKQSVVTRALLQLATGNLLDARFGGSKLMRGFDSNRFIGHQAFTTQNEYRYQINRHFGAVGFLSLGKIDTQEDILINYGIGLRVGLPPDQTQQIRVDFGFDTDGNNTFMLQFNQAI